MGFGKVTLVSMSFLHIESLTKKAKIARENEYIHFGAPKNGNV